MDTPKRMSLAETQARISNYLIFGCRRDESNQVSCAQCGGEIRRVRAYMSLHMSDSETRASVRRAPGAWRFHIVRPAKRRPAATAAFT